MALKKGINVRHGRQYGEPGATSASELAYDANTTTKQKIDALATEVAGKADLTDLAPAFSTATAYTVGKYVSYDGNIYKCTSAHSAGAWAAGDFTLVAVGSELEGKQDTLTFDNAPTNGSNNPVKSDGIYDALAGKQDIFERISYADWQLLTPQQQAAKPYYIYDYPSTQITAANVSYDHTQSGLSATTAQGGIDELASEKQDATDNSLQTTDKTIVGGINELKSGLTNVDSNLNGIMSIIHTATYGRTETPINIDTLGDGKPYMYLVEDSSGFSGLSPVTVLGGGSTFLLIGIGNAPTQPYGWGAQIAFSFTSANIAIRNANYNANAWSAWNIITSSTPT